MSEEDNIEYFISGLQPETGKKVAFEEPLSLVEAKTLAVKVETYFTKSSGFRKEHEHKHKIINGANPTKEIGSSRMAKKRSMVMVKRGLMVMVKKGLTVMVKREPIVMTKKGTRMVSNQGSMETVKGPMIPQNFLKETVRFLVIVVVK